MQEEVENRTVTLAISTTKLTFRTIVNGYHAVSYTHLRVVHGLMVELRVQRDRHHLVIKADVLAQHGKTDGQRHAVLAAGRCV